jgi:hypothetical protein
MSGFLYYLPGARGSITAEELAAGPLAYAFDQRSRVTPCQVSGGPDGGSGLVVADNRRVPDVRIRYKTAEQQWQAMPWLLGNGKKSKIAGDEHPPWVGFYTADRPGPEALLRDPALDGHPVRLGDGNRWVIPVARGCAQVEEGLVGYCNLPETTGLDWTSGEWVNKGVTDKYARLWEVATRWWDAITGKVLEDAEAEDESEGLELDFSGKRDAALSVLQANYAIGTAEVALLELLDDQAINEVLCACVDWPTWTARLEKKTAPPDSASGS